MSEEELKNKLYDVITNINNKYEEREREREELFNELSDEWLSTGNNLNHCYERYYKVSE